VPWPFWLIAGTRYDRVESDLTGTTIRIPFVA
jgi:hypothetical protein